MKKSLTLCIVLFAMLTTFAAKLPSSIDQKKTAPTETTETKTTTVETDKVSSLQAFSQLNVHDLQKTLGRKLTIKEKISWFLFKKHFIHIDPSETEIKHANSNAILGFIFSLLAILIFPLFAIPGIILSNKALDAERADPGILKGGNRGLAKAGQIISWVAVALVVVVLILLLAFLSSFH